MTFRTFFDLETTDKNPNSAEVLTGFFETFEDEVKIDELYVECRPFLYKDDAYEIHKIHRDTAMAFPPQKEGMLSIFKYLKGYPKTVVCHANYQMFGVKGYYDWQVLRNWCYMNDVQDKFYKSFNHYTVESTHTMARKSIHLKNYSLNNVAEYFKIKLDHHNCKSDAQACRQIYFRLLETKSSLLDFMEVPNE